MREKAVFVEVEALRGRKSGRVVSPVALEIHVRAVDHSVRTACPAFITDDGLNSIASGQVTTMAALELCLAGLWHRAKNGYVVSDFDLIDHMSACEARRRLRSMRSLWARRALDACRRSWDAINRENFIPL
jgi:hypothetical protein